MPSQRIMDNVILVQELFHSSSEARERDMIIKLDMANAFD